jgi:hypothetical protein
METLGKLDIGFARLRLEQGTPGQAEMALEQLRDVRYGVRCGRHLDPGCGKPARQRCGIFG